MSGKGFFDYVNELLNKQHRENEELKKELDCNGFVLKIIDREIERFEHELCFVGHVHISERSNMEYTLNFLKELKKEFEE